jgi:hypothetical protein
MYKIKGIYKNGKIELSEPIPEKISSAEISIFFFTKDTEDKLLVNKTKIKNPSQISDNKFKQMKLETFFYSEDDSDVDWEDHFGIK